MKNFLYFLSLCPSCLALSLCITREDHGLVFSGTTLEVWRADNFPKATSSPGSKAPVPQLLLRGDAPAPQGSWWSFTELTPVYQSCMGGPGTFPQGLSVIWVLNSGVNNFPWFTSWIPRCCWPFLLGQEIHIQLPVCQEIHSQLPVCQDLHSVPFQQICSPVMTRGLLPRCRTWHLLLNFATLLLVHSSNLHKLLWIMALAISPYLLTWSPRPKKFLPKTLTIKKHLSYLKRKTYARWSFTS